MNHHDALSAFLCADDAAQSGDHPEGHDGAEEQAGLRQRQASVPGDAALPGPGRSTGTVQRHRSASQGQRDGPGQGDTGEC